MTKEQFLRNNRGINGDKDLDPEYLGVREATQTRPSDSSHFTFVSFHLIWSGLLSPSHYSFDSRFIFAGHL